MMIIGIDAHKRSHTAAVTIDEMGRAGFAKTVGTTTQDHLLLRWASGVGEERLWAIEDCLHNLVHLAKAIASLDQISGGPH
jgi:transposase